MKTLKRIGLGLLAVIGLLLIIALFLPKNFSIERSVVVNKPVPVVFPYIRQVKNQDKFSYWNMQDPNSKKTYEGTDGTVGFVYSWDSQNDHVGKGSQTIAGIEENRKVSFDLHFEKPFRNDAKSFMMTDAESPLSTKVSWRFEGHTPYPMNLMSVMMKQMLGDQLQAGLNNLKKNLDGN